MAQFCPLCGKTKPEETLFCDDCSKKINKEFEVEIPAEPSKENLSDTNDLPVGGKDALPDSTTLGNNINAEDEAGGANGHPVLKKEAATEEAKGVGAMRETNTPVVGKGGEASNSKSLTTDSINVPAPKRKKRAVTTPVVFLLTIALLAGAFLIYNATIRKSNLERGAWETAVKENSTEGYLSYMESHPRGIHFDEARTGLFKLKADEASTWERMKNTDNITELRDFLNLHPGSPYTPLVKTRLDSLIWEGTLKTNTAESYSDYILLSEEGGIRGDYIAEAEKRYKLLFITQPADAEVLHKIRGTINGFFVALSTLDNSGMLTCLAPVVQRFFDSGVADRERIAGELVVTGAVTKGATMQFIPDEGSIKFEPTDNNHYMINVPLVKSYKKNGGMEQVHGYIAHAELDSLFRIISIFETKPYPEAP